MNEEARKNLKFNYIVNLIDGGFFGFGLGFASFSTMLPLFVANLTSSATLIGLIPAIHNMGWQLPQLLTAKKISRLSRMKPYVLLATIQERLPFLGFAIVAWLIHRLPGCAGDHFHLINCSRIGCGDHRKRLVDYDRESNTRGISSHLFWLSERLRQPVFQPGGCHCRIYAGENLLPQ
jgi:hypothetical protein